MDKIPLTHSTPQLQKSSYISKSWNSQQNWKHNHKLSIVQKMSVLPTLFWLCHSEITRPMKSTALEFNLLIPTDIWFHYFYLYHMVQIMKETANIWEYKAGIDANIANSVCLWKCRMILSEQGQDYTHVFRQFKAPVSDAFHRDLPLCFENVLPGLPSSFLVSSICFSFVCPFLRELSAPMISV